MGGTTDRPRIALVLGSGGVAGGAYHAGVLKALNDAWGIDARTVDTIVGTSAGSLAGALLAAGLHPNDLFRRETGSPLSPAGTAIVNRGRRPRRKRRPTVMSTMGVPAAPEAFWRAVTHPRRVAAGSVAAALLPRGTTPTEPLTHLIDDVVGPTWPTGPTLRIVAVELSSARRVVFGPGRPERDDDADPHDHPDPHADLGRRARFVPTTPGLAVAASCAIPSVYTPVTIGDREHIDGGVHSSDNLDLVGTSAYDLVVVSSPLSTTEPLAGGLSMLAVRQLTRLQTARERRSLGSIGHLEILRPTVADLDAMGPNPLDPRRRPGVAHQAHRSAMAQLGRRASPVGAFPAESGRSARNRPHQSRIMAS